MTIDDPIRLDDTFLDPDGPQARAILSAVLSQRPRRSRRRRLLPALAVTAAALAALLVTIPHRDDSLAAMRKAAGHTAAATSGHILWHVEDGPATIDEDIRFDGADWTTRGTSTLPGGPSTSAEIRLVGGRLYAQHDGAWSEQPIPAGAVMAPQQSGMVAAPDAAKLIAALPNAATADGTTYTAGVASDALAGAISAPLLKVLGGPGTIAVRTTIDAGDVTMIELREGATLVRVRFLELGQPQQIVAPPIGG
jgi:hypothetical protein